MAASYDFTTVINREPQGSVKWRMMRQIKPDVGPDVVPLSVADMELRNPPEITEGLKDFLTDMVLGYTEPTQSYFDAVIGWMRRRHGFSPKQEWFFSTSGVMAAIRLAVRAVTAPQDSILIMTPVYYPFLSASQLDGRKQIQSALVPQGDTYDINWDDFEEKLHRPEVKLFIFCSPHNPIGRVWTRAEVERICKLCAQHGVFLVADEIHSDLILPGYAHTSVATITGYLDNCAVCTAPSKTFNLAGMLTANTFVPNAAIRERMKQLDETFVLGALGYKTCEIAYNECEGWLTQLINLLERNRKLVVDFLAKELPTFHCCQLQGTYLQWIDCRSMGLSIQEQERFMQQEAELFLDEGYLFGPGGEGFERILLACPTHVLQSALNRLLTAVRRAQAEGRLPLAL